MVITGGKTILSSFFIIGFFLVCDTFRSRSKNISTSFFDNTPFPKTIKYKTLLGDLFLFSFLIYAWEAIFIFQNDDFAYIIPHFDLLFYGELSDSLIKFKTENFYSVGNLMGSDFDGLTPYHYFDLWLDAFFSSLFNVKGVIAVLFFTYPVLVFTTLIGFFSLIENVTKPTLKWKIFSVSFFFIAGAYFNFYSDINFLRNIGVYSVSPTYSIFKKLIVYYPFLILFFILFIRKSYYRAFLTLLCLPVISISTSYSVYGGIVLFVFVDTLFFHTISKYIIGKIFIATISVVLFQAFFYIIFGNKIVVSISINDIIDFYSNQPKFIFTWINISGGAIINSLILYIPYIAIFILFFKRIKFLWNESIKVYIIWLVCAFFAGLAGWALFYFFIESIQFFYNFSFIPINLLIAYILIVLIKDQGAISFKKNPAHLAGMFIFFILIGNQFYKSLEEKYSQKTSGNKIYSEQYINDLVAINAKKELNGTGVFLYPKDFYPPDFNILIIADFVGSYFPFLQGYHRTINLSLFDIPSKNNYLDQFRLVKALEGKIFYRFVMHQKEKGEFKSVEKSQIDFIDEYNIDYLILAKGAKLTKELEGRVLKIIDDDVSGQKFILLKHY